MGKIFKTFTCRTMGEKLFVFTPLFFFRECYTCGFNVKKFSLFFFSLTASSIYVLNDYSDIESDKKHPENVKDH